MRRGRAGLHFAAALFNIVGLHWWAGVDVSSKLIVANWKMNGSLRMVGEILPALAGLPQGRAVVCVPFPYLLAAGQALAGMGVAIGAQNLSEHSAGAYTGEVSAGMLADVGCQYVIVGHSERRTLNAETDALVAEKMQKAIAAGLTPIVCVGESLAERDAGLAQAIVSRQVAALQLCGSEKVVLAYEPVWAIGTGRVASPEQVEEVHAHLRFLVGDQVSLLYGGSVKADNAASILSIKDVDGALVGGASLVAEDFRAICLAVE